MEMMVHEMRAEREEREKKIRKASVSMHTHTPCYIVPMHILLGDGRRGSIVCAKRCSPEISHDSMHPNHGNGSTIILILGAR